MDEASRIYRALFKKDAPLIIKERYKAASAKLTCGFSDEERNEYLFALAEISDLEALEVAARFRRRVPCLTACFQLMVHLAETLPENRSFFVNGRDHKLHAWGTIFWSGLRTTYKMAKGLYLMRKIRHA